MPCWTMRISYYLRLERRTCRKLASSLKLISNHWGEVSRYRARAERCSVALEYLIVREERRHRKLIVRSA